ncbi:potassium channel family protein [Gordonia sp. PDNC005]|uniref:potassium channel family protein n=1 Tax=Gordonia sp. PDNC005 TaxID=2811424 RepID=UPI001964D073|nr:potassium channel family protein [Gordonia sp. PDNC005]QRY62049.1 potassium channel family protein [Gordonia sp. PDNC005]
MTSSSEQAARRPSRLSRRAAWERHSEPVLAAAAVAFLIAYDAPIVKSDLSPGWQSACTAATIVAWIIFALDYVARLILTGDKRYFIRHNWFDALILAMPVLRPLRALRLVALLSIAHRAGTNTLRGRVVTYAAGGTTLLLILSSLAITDAERGQPGATINGIGDGLWWSITTMTTVGYGDRYPVTASGRFIAAALMLAGIALLGVVTATVASWLIERIDDAKKQEATTQALVNELRIEIERLHKRLDAREQLAESDDQRDTGN